jgi:NADH-quinone oxidoreductase subunit L
LERTLAAVSMLVALLGWFVADTLYRRKPQLAASMAERCSGLHRLVFNKFWVDEIYGALVVRPLLAVARVALGAGVESIAIDGATTAAACGASSLSTFVRRMQSGNIRSYAGWLALGAAALLLFLAYGAHCI